MVNYKYSILKILSIITISLASLTSVTPASAEMSATLTPDNKIEIAEALEHYGVNKNTTQYLISRYEHGYAWDSISPGKTPKSTIQKKTPYIIETIKTYEDGSIAVSTVPNFTELTHSSQTRSITGCQYHQSGATRYWKNCDGTVNLIFISMGFNFNYQNIHHSKPKITHYGPYHHHIIGGALSNFRFNRISNSQIRLSADLDVAFKGFPIGWTAWMQVNVTGDNAWTSNN